MAMMMASVASYLGDMLLLLLLLFTRVVICEVLRVVEFLYNVHNNNNTSGEQD